MLIIKWVHVSLFDHLISWASPYGCSHLCIWHIPCMKFHVFILHFVKTLNIAKKNSTFVKYFNLQLCQVSCNIINLTFIFIIILDSLSISLHINETFSLTNILLSSHIMHTYTSSSLRNSIKPTEAKWKDLHS